MKQVLNDRKMHVERSLSFLTNIIQIYKNKNDDESKEKFKIVKSLIKSYQKELKEIDRKLEDI